MHYYLAMKECLTATWAPFCAAIRVAIFGTGPLFRRFTNLKIRYSG